jgi:hypothetical protein
MDTSQVRQVVSSTISHIDASDLSQHFGIDAVDEITKILSKQLGQSFRKQRIQSKIKNFFDL